MAEAAAEPPRPETVAADEEAPKAAADKAPATPATSSTVAGDSDDDVKSKRVTLADLSAKGTALYAHKKYEDACDIFSTASILQAEINGETAPENAEILFHYGRSLFKVGQSKSDVLGGPPPAAVAAPTAEVPEKGAASTAAAAQVQKAVEAAAEKEHKEKNDDAAADDAKKPLFQFTGDENFDQPDDEDDAEAAEEEGEEEEEDDLAMAFEILDLARVCYTKQLDQLEQADAADKGKEAAAPSESSAVRHIKERLADTYDCLAEIALENERYVNAIEDGRTSLKHKLELYPEDSRR
ncbi:hypothetical protein CDD83_11143 [Cordyceps sp. RAO-2017]|nr:hypothetical protein CDD83_11143 [Cordyceps sp. RAO-2017]